MSIKFQCVECGCEVKVPDSAAGKRGKCPQCSAVNDVPKPIDVSSDDDFFDFILSEVGTNRPPEDDSPIPFDDDELVLPEARPDIPPTPAPAPTPAPIPTPPEPAPVDSDDDDLLGLAPVDEDEERQREEQVRQLMEQERELLTDADGAKPLEHREDIDASDLHHFIVNYCRDMVDGKLEKAKTHVAQLRKYRGLAGEAIDSFLAGKADPIDLQALAHIPPPVLAGFLKSLKGDLG